MKTELGAEAIVLNTRKVHKGGLLNFVGKEVFEITAAVDDASSSTSNSYSSSGRKFQEAPPRNGLNATRESSGRTTSSDTAVAGLAQIAQEFEQRNRRNAAVSSARKTQDASDLHELKSEIEDIKSTLNEIAGQMKYSHMPALPDPLKRVYATLVEQDVDEQFASDLVQAVYVKLGENAIDDENAIEQYVLGALAGVFRSAEPLGTPREGRTTVALVGPTGVGKTTTIAKLAAQRKLVDGLSVALVSADTYRIGAIEQLQTFAAIADIPMEVAYAPAEMEDALRKFRSKDVVYVDTVGRNPYRKSEVAEIGEFLACAGIDEVHLVLSASTQTRTLLESVERFSVLKPNRFLITKADEAASFGSLLRLVKQYPIPVSFVTTGQAVPEDIVAVRPLDLATMIYNGVLPHA
jgi:flagellar biosynthesis protein FlhF